MTRLLPFLYEGHAPITLQNAFSEALDAFETWEPGTDEPTVEFEGALVPVSSIFGRMRSCFDIVPQRVLDAVDDVAGTTFCETFGGRGNATFSEVAGVLRGLCIERLKHVPPSGGVRFAPSHGAGRGAPARVT